MKRIKFRKKITAIALVIVFLMTTRLCIPRVLAAVSYSGFSVNDELSIYLIGSDAQYDTLSYSVDALIALYQINSPEIKLTEKNYTIYAKQGQVYTENETALSAQMQDYLDLKGQAELANDAALAAYYQNLYNQTLAQKATVTYQKEINQFFIDNQVTLMQNEENKTRKEFVTQVNSLINLEYQLSYTSKVLEYQYTVAATQKAKLGQEKILQSEYDLALAEVAKTNAQLSTIQTSIQNTANYIRQQTGIANTQDIIIKYDIKKVKNLSITTYNGLVEAQWGNNLDVELLDQEIISRTNQRNSLLPLYNADSNQSQLYLLEIEKVGLEKSSLTLQQEQQKLEQKNLYVTLRNSYDAAVSRASALSKIAYEKRCLTDLGMATKLEMLKAEMDRDQALLELYSYIYQLSTIIS